jgi:hypothetical protein
MPGSKKSWKENFNAKKRRYNYEKIFYDRAFIVATGVGRFFAQYASG